MHPRMPSRLTQLLNCFFGEDPARMRRSLLQVGRSAASQQSNRHRHLIDDQRRRPRPTSGAILSRRSIWKFTCHIVVLNLLIWPTPGATLKTILTPVPALASTVGSTMSALSSAGGEVGSFFSGLAKSILFIPTGPVVVPVPLLPLWPFQLSKESARELSMAERTAGVTAVKVSPHKLVGYVGDSLTFVGIGTDSADQPVHGAKLTWESSHPDRLTIDDAGQATLLHPGLVRVTAHAGLAQQTVGVLIRPTQRRIQTDLEWQVDQDSFDGSTIGQTNAESLVAKLMVRLAPTASAQGGGQGADYANAWPGHVGTPPFAALEQTRLGPVMPGNNFELPLPLVDLGGRGMATSLTAYYNSNVWGATLGQNTTYVFDPIQSWPSPGFSLGFGRIIIYDYSYYDGVGWGYKYMLIDPNGTRHNLGVGSGTGSNTLETKDGSHITYVGNALGGTLYYQDGTRMTISLVNNRRLPTQITDTNGNYIQIAYKWETNYPGIAINYIVDTLGRVIQFNYGEWPAPPGSTLLTSITTPTGGVTFNYQTVTMNHNFQNEILVANAPASFSGISTITSLGKPTYGFSYSGYGMIYNIVASSAAGTATVTYDYPLGGEELYAG